MEMQGPSSLPTSFVKALPAWAAYIYVTSQSCCTAIGEPARIGRSEGPAPGLPAVQLHRSGDLVMPFHHNDEPTSSWFG